MLVGRRVGIGSIAVLAALSLAACGGGAPDDASTEEFCATWTESLGNTLDEVHESAERLEEVGTPEDAYGAARDGFEVFVDALAGIDQDELEALDQVAADDAGLAELYGISEDEAADVVAFFDYANGACVDGESDG